MSLPTEPGPYTEKQSEEVHSLTQPWSDDFAIKTVNQDFSSAENFRNAGHDWRWRAADELYLAWVQQNYWEGTRVPKSSLASHLAFSQIESVLPLLIGALFGDNPWFECDPRPGTSMGQAEAVQYLLAWQTEDMGRDDGLLFKEEHRKAAKSALIYGNGILEMGWEEIERTRRLHLIERVPRVIEHPIFGPIPTQEFDRRFRWMDVPENISRPWVKYRSIRDFYIDPNCNAPSVKAARFIIQRELVAVDDLDAMRDIDGFKIPSRPELLELAQNKSSSQGDQGRIAQESMRGVNYMPANDYTADPSGKRIEVFRYWTKGRLVWVLNRQVTAYNESNPYGFIPFYSYIYTDVPDRFYGISITDAVEGEDRLSTSIINARVNELSLAIHPQTIKRLGVQIPAAQLRRRPGGFLEVPNPKEDIIREPVQDITQSAYIEVAAAENRAQKITGVTDLAVLGTPTAGGNSASRTATGVSTQASASQRRIQFLVENAETMVIEPMLYDMHTLNIRYLDPLQVQQVLGPMGEQIEIDPMAVLNAQVRLTMRAGARMQSRAAILQVYPLIAQYIFNPALIGMLASQQGITPDVAQFLGILLEAAGYKQKSSQLFRPLTPEEQERMNQPPVEEVLRMQMQRERLESSEANADTQAMSKVMSSIIGTGMKALEEKPKSNGRPS